MVWHSKVWIVSIVALCLASPMNAMNTPLRARQTVHSSDTTEQKARGEKSRFSVSGPKRYIQQKLGLKRLYKDKKERQRIATAIGQYVQYMYGNQLKDDPYTGKLIQEALPKDLCKIVRDYLRADYVRYTKWSPPISEIRSNIQQLSVPIGSTDLLTIDLSSDAMYTIDVNSGKVRWTFQSLMRGGTKSTGALTNGRVLIFPHLDTQQTFIYNSQERNYGEVEAPAEFSPHEINRCITMPDGRVAVACRTTLYMWHDGTGIKEFVSNLPDGNQVALLPDGHIALSYSLENPTRVDRIEILDGQTGKKRKEIPSTPAPGNHTTIAHVIALDGTTLLTINQDNSVRTWDMSTNISNMLIPSAPTEDASQKTRQNITQNPAIALPHRLFVLPDPLQAQFTIHSGDTGAIYATISTKAKVSAMVALTTHQRFAVGDDKGNVIIYEPLHNMIFRLMVNDKKRGQPPSHAAST